MKHQIQPQDWTEIATGEAYIKITQEDVSGNEDVIWIDPDNAERFCAMVMECAREMLKGEVKGEQ